MLKLYLRFLNLIGSERGASMAEYGILLALIAIVAVAGTTVLGNAIDTTLTEAAASMP